MNWDNDPYPHTIGTGFFTPDRYAEMLANLPPDSDYEQYNAIYAKRYLYLGKGRSPTKGFWGDVWARLQKEFGRTAIIQMVRDLPGYSIGPHTDKESKNETFLFYLTDKDVLNAGTTVFIPKPGFAHRGSLHHDFKDFDAVKTAPYVPNGYFGFKRSQNSYHGVFPCDIVRNVIQVSVYR